MPADTHRSASRTALRSRFNRLSSQFDHAEFLYKELRQRMLERLRMLQATRRHDFKPTTILDLGSARGDLARATQKVFSGASVIALDFAEALLNTHRDSWLSRFTGQRVDALCADVQQLPLKNASIDLVVSNALLHHCYPSDSTFNSVLNEVRRVMRPGAAFAFTTFGPNTLRELRSAWSQVDQLDHVQPLIDMQTLGDVLLRAGLTDPVLDSETLHLTYSSFDNLLVELRALGGAPLRTAIGLTQGLGGRQALASLRSAYESLRGAEGLPVTVEIIHGLAWAATNDPDRQRPGDQPGETLIPLTMLRRKR